ncbi:MAG TPA: glutamine amidotransferase [Aquabacterium sp.]|nr:glutamine amidotransferase [Aquabacterium sp.]
MKKRAAIIQHLAFEDLGSFESVLIDRGYTLHSFQAGVDALDEPMRDADLVVVLGGPIGVYETTTYPFLNDEITHLRDRLSRDLPTLGICLGAQLIAQALGGQVYPGGKKEIGWGPLQLTPSGQSSALRYLQGVAVLHWHGDTFDLPPGARLLGSTHLYPHQAFDRGSNVLALQCHPEALGRTFERWLIGHAAELNSAGLDILALREQSKAYAPALEQAATAMLHDWLASLTSTQILARDA